MDSFIMGGKQVGPSNPPLIIAEVAQAHEGSLNMAHSFIDAAADAGADAVKFQTHIASAESTPSEPWRVKFTHKNETRFEYWRRMEFLPEEWKGLADHSKKQGLLFLSSPFSPQAVDLLYEVGQPAWKVASGEVSNTPLLETMARTGLPLLISSGMSSLAELDAAVDLVRRFGTPVGVFQCTTSYPCPPGRVGLNLLAEYRSRYNVPVGLSDHSGQIYAGLAAAALGANFLEVHVTFSRQMFGPDVPASLTFAELAQLTDGAKKIHQMLMNPLQKDVIAEEMAPLRRLFNKSIVAAKPLLTGSIINQEDLALKKPGTGLPADLIPTLIGRALIRDIPTDHQLSESDLQQSDQATLTRIDIK